MGVIASVDHSNDNLSDAAALTEEKKALMVDKISEEVITMQVTVQVSADVAQILHKQAPPTTESQELFRLLEDLNIILKPIHPGAKDPLLTPYFIIEVSDSAAAERVIALLRNLKSIGAAYLKPLDELP